MMRGEWGWLALAALVLAYDTWAVATGHETMSAAFARALRHPARRWVVLAAWGTTSAHLFGRIPEQVDPFHAYMRILGRYGRLERGFCVTHVAGVLIPQAE